MLKTTKFIGASSTLLVLGLMLTGCSAEQSQADACDQLQDGMTSLQSDLTDTMGDIATDPTAGADAIAEIADQFSENVDGITNEEVKAAGDEAATALQTMSDDFSAYAEDPADTASIEAMSTSATDAQTAMTELTELCG
jgi:ABC-type glycerol-3-phosphate transport system substrate-binding protein